jgi:hypothetical protein
MYVNQSAAKIQQLENVQLEVPLSLKSEETTSLSRVIKKGNILSLKGKATLDHTLKSFTDCGILLLTLQSSKSLKSTFNLTHKSQSHTPCALKP